jgi:hypothetical protein
MRPIPAITAGNELSKRNPTASPTSTIAASASALRNRSANERPASTAERAIGRLRKRSTIPLFRSCARPIAVVIPPMSTASMNTAGTTKFT